MWIISETGFVSIVRAVEDPTLLAVRGRVRDDVARFGSLYMGVVPAVQHDERRDYPYRLFAKPKEIAKAMERAVRLVSYSDFKNRVAQVSRQESGPRSNVYAVIWRALRDLEALNG